MVEICVAGADTSGLYDLVRRLAIAFDWSSVSFDEQDNEVRVRSELESRTVVLVLNAVEAWLAENSVGSAKLSIGDRSYTMFGPDHEQPVIVDRERGTRQRFARPVRGRRRSGSWACLRLRSPVER
jgi:hypothetical protein